MTTFLVLFINREIMKKFLLMLLLVIFFVPAGAQDNILGIPFGISKERLKKKLEKKFKGKGYLFDAHTGYAFAGDKTASLVVNGFCFDIVCCYCIGTDYFNRYILAYEAQTLKEAMAYYKLLKIKLGDCYPLGDDEKNEDSIILCRHFYKDKNKNRYFLVLSVDYSDDAYCVMLLQGERF